MLNLSHLEQKCSNAISQILKKTNCLIEAKLFSLEKSIIKEPQKGIVWGTRSDKPSVSNWRTSWQTRDTRDILFTVIQLLYWLRQKSAALRRMKGGLWKSILHLETITRLACQSQLQCPSGHPPFCLTTFYRRSNREVRMHSQLWFSVTLRSILNQTLGAHWKLISFQHSILFTVSGFFSFVFFCLQSTFTLNGTPSRTFTH